MKTKLPTDQRSLVRDPDLAAALEAIVDPLDGEELERAHAAIRQVRGSGVQGTFPEVLAAYESAISAAVDGG